MPILDVVKFPDKRLRLKSKSIDLIDDSIKSLVEDMIDTMYFENGLGLSAIQVGKPLRLFIIDFDQRESGEKNRDKVNVFINPELSNFQDEIVMEKEGCLSLPNIREDVKRFNKCRVSAQNINGETFTIDAEGILAIALQHENDHLEGTLFIDRLSKLKQNFLIKKYLKMVKSNEKRD